MEVTTVSYSYAIDGFINNKWAFHNNNNFSVFSVSLWSIVFMRVTTVSYSYAIDGFINHKWAFHNNNNFSVFSVPLW
jgi:hypothetical protein